MMLRTLLVLVALCTVGAFRPLLHRPVHRQLTVGPQLGRSRLLRLAESEESVLDADEPPGLVDGIVPVELNDELKASFMSYAMSTILGRALPDARDGMKPVHRRVLYAMQVLGLTPDSGYRKCARIVGEVLGKYHPHGDQSVYDALVRMAQDFVMLHPLVSGHGNFGSVDNDPPAAMRYTEARLSSLAFESLLTDIKEDTVDFLPNFDGNEEEPAVLPARLPTLLLNGASGIAVGMATNIPPHNLGELADAVIALIDKPDLDDEELFRIIPAPDFPTGGVILGAEGARKMYETGKGSVVVRAQSHMEMITSGTKAGTRTRNAIIITELPYMTNKAGLLEKIADLVNDKKLEGIADLRDETDRDGMRMVVELKRDAIPEVVRNNLFKKTALQTTYSGNMLALVEEGTQPRRLTLRDMLKVFIDFRFVTVRRRTAHRLAKVQARDHVVQGMLKALSMIDQIIHIMKTSSDTAGAKDSLMGENFGFSSEQAESIMGLTLRRLTAMEETKLSDEHEDLSKQIEVLSKLMSEDQEVNKLIKKETRELRNRHATPRKSVIVVDQGELSEMDLLPNERSVISITDSGYIKRMPILEFEAQSRGGKGKAGSRMSNTKDSVAHFFTCNDHDTIIFCTDRGIAYSKRAYQIPLSSRTAKGVPLPQVLPISQAEHVTSVIDVDSFDDTDEHLVLLTRNGYCKKTPLKAFQSMSQRGLVIISLEEGDSLKWARRCLPQDEVLIATKNGFASRFASGDLISSGRKSRGVRALNLRKGDSMADMDIITPTTSGLAADEAFVLVITERGYGKRISIDEFRTQKRGGKGVIIIKYKSKEAADALSCLRICVPGDEVVLSTSRGSVMRQRTDDISLQGRTATGVLIQSLAADDSIVTVDLVPPLLLQAEMEEGA